MTEMTDLSSDLEASRIPFVDYRTYAERVLFPGRNSGTLQRPSGGRVKKSPGHPCTRACAALQPAQQQALPLDREGHVGRLEGGPGVKREAGWSAGIGYMVGRPRGLPGSPSELVPPAPA